MDYEKLYSLQDEILDSFKKNNSTLYFTGGTLLNRFYCQNRYSDDLDFFGYKDSFFKDQIEDILSPFVGRFEMIVNSKDFFRVLLDGVLKVDFCNDFVKPVSLVEINGIKSSSLLDILTNKLCTIIDRDEYKDVVDLVSICTLLDVDFREILKLTEEKQVFELAHLVFRLETFPFEMIDIYKIKNSAFLRKENFTKALNLITKAVSGQMLCKKDSVLELLG